MDTSSIVLETPRLLLRDFRPADEERIVGFFSEASAQPYILRHQRSPQKMSTYVKRFAEYADEVPWMSRPHLVLAVVLRETLELIGMCGLTDAAEGSLRAKIGWHYASVTSGFGYASEAGHELIRFAFENRGVARVVADCYESNAANRRVFVKLGMQPLPALSVLRWMLALRYFEPKPIVRYYIENETLGSGALAA